MCARGTACWRREHPPDAAIVVSARPATVGIDPRRGPVRRVGAVPADPAVDVTDHPRRPDRAGVSGRWRRRPDRGDEVGHTAGRRRCRGRLDRARHGDPGVARVHDQPARPRRRRGPRSQRHHPAGARGKRRHRGRTHRDGVVRCRRPGIRRCRVALARRHAAGAGVPVRYPADLSRRRAHLGRPAAHGRHRTGRTRARSPGRPESSVPCSPSWSPSPPRASRRGSTRAARASTPFTRHLRRRTRTRPSAARRTVHPGHSGLGEGVAHPLHHNPRRRTTRRGERDRDGLRRRPTRPTTGDRVGARHHRFRAPVRAEPARRTVRRGRVARRSTTPRPGLGTRRDRLHRSRHRGPASVPHRAGRGPLRARRRPRSAPARSARPGRARPWSGATRKAGTPRCGPACWRRPMPPTSTSSGSPRWPPPATPSAWRTSLGDVTGGSVFGSYIVAAYTDTYPTSISTPTFARGPHLVREMSQRCLAEPECSSRCCPRCRSRAISRSTAPTRPGRVRSTSAENTPTVPCRSPCCSPRAKPTHSLRRSVQVDYVAARCAEGWNLDYRTYPGKDHMGVIAEDSPLIPDLLGLDRRPPRRRPTDTHCA